jgi:hypothetical protein
MFLALMFSSGCGGERDYGVLQLRNNAEAAKSATQYGADKDAALDVIAKTSELAADKLDPEKKIQPVTTAAAIAQAEKVTPPGLPNPELKKIFESAAAGPVPSIPWGSIAGGALIAIGLAGKFLGPPYNIVGQLAQVAGSKLIPTYERDRKVAVGAIVATEQALGQYGELLNLTPEVKARLQEKLGGQDPVQWLKEKLETAQQDLGIQSEVGELISTLKKEVTTKDGVIAPKIEEFDKFVSKKI